MVTNWEFMDEIAFIRNSVGFNLKKSALMAVCVVDMMSTIALVSMSNLLVDIYLDALYPKANVSMSLRVSESKNW